MFPESQSDFSRKSEPKKRTAQRFFFLLARGRSCSVSHARPFPFFWKPLPRSTWVISRAVRQCSNILQNFSSDESAPFGVLFMRVFNYIEPLPCMCRPHSTSANCSALPVCTAKMRPVFQLYPASRVGLGCEEVKEDSLNFNKAGKTLVSRASRPVVFASVCKDKTWRYKAYVEKCGWKSSLYYSTPSIKCLAVELVLSWETGTFHGCSCM